MPKFKFKLGPDAPFPLKLLEIEVLNVQQTEDGRLVADVRFKVFMPFD